MSNESGEKFTVTERLVEQPDGTLVSEDRAFNGGTLKFVVGQVIAVEVAEKYGLIKQAAPPANKKAKKGEDK